MRLRGLSLFGLLCIAFAVPAAAEFTFRIPEGFEDLSPGVPGVSYTDLPGPLVAELSSGKYAAFAMEFLEEDGFYENFNAVVSEGSLVIDDSSAEEWRERASTELSKAMGGPVTVLRVEVTSLGGVPVIRAVYDAALPTFRLRQLQYVVPGGKEYAILTYSSTPEKFDRYVQRFDAAAMATIGAEEAKVVDWWRAARAGFWGGGLGLGVALVAALVRRGRRTPPARPQRRMPPRPAPRR